MPWLVKWNDGDHEKLWYKLSFLLGSLSFNSALSKQHVIQMQNHNINPKVCITGVMIIIYLLILNLTGISKNEIQMKP